MQKLAACLAVLLAFAPAVRAAGTAMEFDRIQLSASAELEVPADLVTASLFVEREGSSTSKLAAAVNEAMAWALAEARKIDGIKTETGQYTSYPVYGSKPGQISAWHVRQVLRLSGRDPRVMGELVGTLQERLAVEAMDYTVSSDTRTAAEDRLGSAALARFQQRAQQIAQALGRSSYKLITLDVGGLGQPMPLMRYRSAKLDMAESAAPAQIEPATQNLSLTVTGSIQLDRAP